MEHWNEEVIKLFGNVDKDKCKALILWLQLLERSAHYSYFQKSIFYQPLKVYFENSNQKHAVTYQWICKSSWNFKGILNSYRMILGEARAPCITQTTDIHLHQNTSSLYFIKLHYWHMKSCDAAGGDCVLWKFLAHTSGWVTYTPAGKRNPSNHKIHI